MPRPGGQSPVGAGRQPVRRRRVCVRGRRGDTLKVLWSTGDGLCLLSKRLEAGRFVWPQAEGGKIHLTTAQLSMLLEGIDWRHPRRTVALSML
ncbi:IS66 family insertion sequence element accessory protein TnpB [Caballeronia sordidicola]|uniref:IS66 family insertion sequence element accessory protein TnpB n=1 Tax=Caballeronia sordidicola TaxID=196367 RepID=UPI004037B2B4